MLARSFQDQAAGAAATHSGAIQAGGSQVQTGATGLGATPTGAIRAGATGTAPAIARGETPNPLSTIPASADAALDQAMALEGVPASWKDGLGFIMAQESAGKVDARNPVHTARGLFQLTAANYHLNPNSAASFGDAVQEVQGGIRYIQERYGTAHNAVQFWQTHHWY